jgi:hypothetical protein
MNINYYEEMYFLRTTNNFLILTMALVNGGEESSERTPVPTAVVTQR